MSTSLLVTPNQSYLVKQMETKIAAALAGTLGIDLGGNITGKGGNTPWKNPFNVLYYPSQWQIDKMDFYCRRHAATTEPLVLLRFRNVRWDTENSDLNYGKKTVDQNIFERDAAKSKIIRNGTDGPIHVAYEESVELTNVFSSSITKGVTLDVTKSKEASIDAEQKVSGSYAGVSAEASLSEHFGVSESKSKSESSERSKERSQEGSHAETLAIEFEAKPRSYYLLEIKYENERTSQPFDINGIMDFDIEIYFNSVINMLNSNCRPGSSISAIGIAGLQQIVHGYDTRYSSLENYWDAKASWIVKTAISWIADPKNRRIQVSGISHASLDSNADYDVELLGNKIPDGLAHLAVVEANSI